MYLKRKRKKYKVREAMTSFYEINFWFFVLQYPSFHFISNKVKMTMHELDMYRHINGNSYNNNITRNKITDF